MIQLHKSVAKSYLCGVRTTQAYDGQLEIATWLSVVQLFMLSLICTLQTNVSFIFFSCAVFHSQS